jgi:3-oxoacyl-[acyl-carrier protein] reductase
MARAVSALVIGGTGSIGRAVVMKLAREGVAVTVASRNASARCPTLFSGPMSSSIAAVDLDVEDAASRRRALQVVGHRHDGLDILIDCSDRMFAGTIGAFAAMDPGQFGPAVQARLTARLEMAHAVRPLLLPRGGAMLFTLSDAGRYAAPLQSIVGATHAALIGFIRNYAMEAARDRIRINGIGCTFVRETETFARLELESASRIAAATARAGLGLPLPDDIAELAAFLCSPAACRITGQIISVNGGLSA